MLTLGMKSMQQSFVKTKVDEDEQEGRGLKRSQFMGCCQNKQSSLELAMEGTQ